MTKKVLCTKRAISLRESPKASPMANVATTLPAKMKMNHILENHQVL